MLDFVQCPYLSQETQNKIEEFIEWSPTSQEDRAEVQSMLQSVSSQDEAKDIESRFLNRLQFGTAGLRGRMGCGYNRMNDLIVMQTSQGIASYLMKTHSPREWATRGVVVGYDGRRGSKKFAHVVASVFLSKHFKVYLSSNLTPTPLIPFSILKYKCLCGIQITASHNPKDDNGYKVYSDNGAQIIPPMDTDISACILNDLKPWQEAQQLLDPASHLLLDAKASPVVAEFLVDPYEEIFEAYLDTITSELCSSRDITAASNVQVVYTPMHGVGTKLCSALVQRFGFKLSNFHVVSEQSSPDPDFPTVKFPNPEEKGALDCSMALADKLGVKIIVANDPDADRFACAEKQPDNTWRIFSGDELGFIFAARALERKAKYCPKEKLLFLCSAVSSRMVQRLAEVEGCQFRDTATGFKWIMNKAIELTNPSQKNPLTFCFAYEEALGYALSMAVPDKDGVSACAAWIQMICQLQQSNMSIAGYLDQLCAKYGQSVTKNSYFLCYHPHIVQQIFNEFRNGGNYPRQLGKSSIRRIRDVTARYDDGETDHQCQLPLTPGSEMITFYFTNGVTITIRTSGTEPKLKYYCEMIGSDRSVLLQTVNETLDDTIKHFLQYQQYRTYLQSPST